MSDHAILDAVLETTQVPHQPLVVIVDFAVFSGLPLFREALRRALNRPGPVVLVTALHDPDDLPHHGATVVNLGVPGLEDDARDVEQTIVSACQSGAQVFIDAVDVIADDHGPAVALNVIRSLLRFIKAGKPPSRLTLFLPHTSPFLPSLFPPTLSPALTLLHPYNPLVLSHLSRSYLLPIDSSPAFTTTLDRARDRQLPEKLAYGGLDGVEVSGDWSSKGGVVSVLVRKPTGGVKGITRALASLQSPSAGPGLVVGPVSDLIATNPIDAPGQGGTADRPAVTHVDLDLPFNCRMRMRVRAWGSSLAKKRMTRTRIDRVAWSGRHGSSQHHNECRMAWCWSSRRLRCVSGTTNASSYLSVLDVHALTLFTKTTYGGTRHVLSDVAPLECYYDLLSDAYPSSCLGQVPPRPKITPATTEYDPSPRPKQENSVARSSPGRQLDRHRASKRSS